MAERTLYQSAPVMRLYIAEHPFHYEMENLCRIFFPYHRIETIPCGTDGNGAHILDYGTLGAYTGMQTELGGIRLQARLFFGGRERTAEERTSLSFRGISRSWNGRMGVLLFGLLTQACAYTPKWGILTGVRPIKLLRSLAEAHGGGSGLAELPAGLAGERGKNGVEAASPWGTSRRFCPFPVPNRLACMFPSRFAPRAVRIAPLCRLLWSAPQSSSQSIWNCSAWKSNIRQRWQRGLASAWNRLYIGGWNAHYAFCEAVGPVAGHDYGGV